MEEFRLSWEVLGTAALVLGALFLARTLPKLMAGVPFIAPADVAQRAREGEDLLVIDVRTPAEFRAGHVQDSMNLPVNELGTRLAALPAEALASVKDTPVYVICQSDSRAAAAARLLRRAGFTRLCVIGGGVGAWQRAGLPYSN